MERYNNICKEHMFFVKYNGLKLVPSPTAMREMMKHSLVIEDCKTILEEGYISPRKRKENIIEKWFDKRNKTYNVVIAKTYNNLYKEEIYLIIHVGRFTRRK